ncbi:hypothetical protein F4604DRAFT_1929367 [Suillus subluteus]|nr:hypothetical protein F4604DRAFT_1929367 [Suillus subluteus]
MTGTPLAPTNNSSSDDEASSTGGQPVVHPDPSQAMPTSSKARAKRRIAALEEELEMMRQERGGKQRKMTLYVAQEDLVVENDRRYEFHSSTESTAEQDRLQRGYIELAQVLPWLHKKLGELDNEDSEDMGADAARSDDTSTLKELVAAWVNQEFRPTPLIKLHEKYSRGFVSDICGKLLCPVEWDWSQDSVKASIHDRMTEYIISENSWPLFVYENYKVNSNDLEEGFLKSRLLILAFKAVFTSPSSARETDGNGNGNGTDIIENNRRTRHKSDQMKVKTCIASIINIRKVTPRAIAYIACQVRFTLSSVLSWHTIDGDFDYEAFWCNIMDFFEDVPGPVTRCKVDKLLEWWTRKIFKTNHREDLTPELVSHMSVNALAEQRKRLEDAAFNSD